MQMDNEEVRDAFGIGVISRSNAVPSLVFATVRGPVWEGAKGIGERVRTLLAANAELIPKELEDQRLYAGFIEPHSKSGALNEAILAPPTTERHALDDWRYVIVGWAVLCFRPKHHTVYGALHADISFGLRDGFLPWGKAMFSSSPIAAITVPNEGSRHTLLMETFTGDGEKTRLVPHRYEIPDGNLRLTPCT